MVGNQISFPPNFKACSTAIGLSPPANPLRTKLPKMKMPSTILLAVAALPTVDSKWFFNNIPESPASTAWRPRSRSSPIRVKRDGLEWICKSKAPEMSTIGIMNPISKTERILDDNETHHLCPDLNSKEFIDISIGKPLYKK